GLGVEAQAADAGLVVPVAEAERRALELGAQRRRQERAGAVAVEQAEQPGQGEVGASRRASTSAIEARSCAVSSGPRPSSSRASCWKTSARPLPTGRWAALSA